MLTIQEKFLPISPDQVQKLRDEMFQFQTVITKDQRIAAEAKLKEAKLVLKTVSESRLNFTRKLDDIKKQAMGPEKEIEEILKPIESAITVQLKKEHEIAEAARRKAEEEAAAERARLQAIVDANTKSKSAITEFVSSYTAQIAQSKDNSELDAIAKHIRAAKYAPQELAENKPSLIEEFEEQKAVLLKLVSRSKKDESVKQIAAEKAEAAAIQLDQIQEQAQEKSLEIAMDADLKIQASAQAAGQVSGARTIWEFETMDLSKIPLEYIMVDEAAVKAAIREGIREIPGLKIYSTVGRSGR